jgi:peptide deformylase
MKLLYYPNDALIARNKPIEAYTPVVAAHVREMFEILARVEGAALAAPQVGWNVKLFILGASGPHDPEAMQRVVWNPTIETSGDLVPMEEGCLSFPEVTGKVARWTRTRLLGQTPEGPIDEVFTGFSAQAVQHEVNHLEGLLFIEKMSPADRRRIAPQLRDLADREYERK